jgi:hypothetical protein
MARNEAQEKARQQLLDYLLFQGAGTSTPFISSDTSYLTDVGKLYEELALNKGMYDSVTPKYRALGDDPRAQTMAAYFDAIGRIGYDPDQIIKEHDAANALNPELQLNETEKADLKKFATEQAKRNETKWEREQAAAYYGIPSPSATWDVPTELVAGLRAQKTGLTNAQAIGKELTVMQQEYDKMMANAPKQSTTGIKTTDFGFDQDRAAWGYNKILGGIGSVGGLFSDGSDSPLKQWAEDQKISKTVTTDVSKSPSAATPNSPRVGALGKQMNQLEKLALAEMDYENRLTQAVAERLSQQFGKPFEKATREAQQIVASRKKGSSGNWLQ